eukprot:scaffold12312_cov248-Ochromonas_danica.AAC.2
MFVNFLKGRLNDFKIDEGVLRESFKLSEAVIKLFEVEQASDGTCNTYVGTGTVFRIKQSDEMVIFTNKHVITASEKTTLVDLSLVVNDERVNFNNWVKHAHSKLDVVKIIVPKEEESHFDGIAFNYNSPLKFEMDRISEFIQLFPSCEKAEDTGFLFFVVGYPLGLEKRVSAQLSLKRIVMNDGVYRHCAPTFAGNSGSILFAVPVGKGTDGTVQGQFMSEEFEGVGFIAGIHYRRTTDNRLNGYVSVNDMLWASWN